jgi:ribokinase
VAEIFVVGSINQDFVLRTERRPRPGETVTGAVLSLHAGGKGANQAVAAALLRSSVALLGRVGDDPFAANLLRALHRAGVDISQVETIPDAATGTAIITVTPDGENSIVVAPGANAHVRVTDVKAGALLGAQVRGLADAQDAARELLGIGPASVVVTLGGEGAVVAGDAFVGALAMRLAGGASLSEAVVCGVRAGAAAVSKEGAQSSLPTPDLLAAR